MPNVDDVFEEMMARVRAEWNKKTQEEKKAAVSTFDKFSQFIRNAAGALWDAISGVLDAIGRGLDWLWERATSWLSF